MSKNDPAAIDCMKRLGMALTHVSLLKSRGLPQDHKKAVEVLNEVPAIVETLKKLLEEDAAEFDNVPDNLVVFVPKGRSPAPRHL